MTTTNLTFDAVSMLKLLAKQIQADIDYAYPHNGLAGDRSKHLFNPGKGHTALVSIQGEVRAMEAVLDNLKEST
jgi:hypothetical protein